MKIEASDTEISKLLKGGFLIIPRFQRPYSWKSDNLRDFWSDITENDEGSYFIGSMVIYAMGSERFGVVDGQQRLTTITILLCGIRDRLQEIGESELAQGVHNYVETPDRDNVKSFVLKTETSFPYLQEEIQKFGDPEIRVQPRDEELRLQAAYDFLKRQIEDYLKKSVVGLLSKTEKLDAQVTALKVLREIVLQLKVIKIELDNEDDAYIIFETLNTRGQDLALSDLIKNNIGSLVAKSGDVDVFKVLWKEITDNVANCGAAAKIDTFFVHSWSSRFTPVTKQRAFKVIKDRISDSIKSAGEDRAREIGLSHLRAFSEDANCYLSIQVPVDNWARFQYKVRDSLASLRLFNVEQQTAYVLSLVRAYREKKISYKTLRKGLVAVENFHFQFNAVTSSRSSGSIASMYARAAKNVHDSLDSNTAGSVIRDLTNELKQRRPSKDEFVVGFRLIKYNTLNRGNAFLKYVLRKFAENEGLTFDADTERLTIEHVFPRSAIGELWTENNVDSIGNLILLSETRNRLVADKSFADKKKLFAEWKASVPLSVMKCDIWVTEDSDNRSTDMAKLAYEKIWNIQ